jgi:hypothetical protein
MDDSDFDFDDIVMNSKAYRRAMVMAAEAISGKGQATLDIASKSKASSIRSDGIGQNKKSQT